jgi:hypothetical protein
MQNMYVMTRGLEVPDDGNHPTEAATPALLDSINSVGIVEMQKAQYRIRSLFLCNTGRKKQQ